MQAQPIASSVSDACRRLGIGKTTLYQLFKAGEIRPVKLGTKTLIPEREMVAFIERLSAKAAA